MKNIKEFRLNKASYFLEDKSGSKLKINVNYKDNKFSFTVLSFGKNINKLKNQATLVAKDMLDRKAKKNLVKKLLELDR